MEFNKTFFDKELRADFLVTEKRKKVWAAELCMLEKFDEICKKYQLTYYAFYGTLLGAVRHQGFIPWDDDIDVVMFRDEYEKFQAIAPMEITSPYFFQNSYTDNIIWPFSKIRDTRTTAIEFTYMKDFHQGIFIDIFPLDSVPDTNNPQFKVIQEMQKLLWRTIVDPRGILEELKEQKIFLIETDFLLKILKENIKWRFSLLENYSLSHFGETQEMNYIMEEIIPSNYKSVKKEWFQNPIYLPFENIQIPVPVEYDKVLMRCYGDYHKFVPGGTAHENIILDPDIPYKEYFERFL